VGPLAGGYLVELVVLDRGDSAYRPTQATITGNILSRTALQLRPDGSKRDLFCFHFLATSIVGGFGDRLVSGNFFYENGLRVICCPAGASFEIVISDTPVLLPPRRQKQAKSKVVG
jgi:hypothetical protein